MNRLIKLWGDLRSSFWFMPAFMVTGSMVVALVLIELDSNVISDPWLKQWPRVFGVGAEGARLMLATLAGSMMTVMGITFSMTLLALALASGQYTSRILRNFMRSRVTQFTLGVFAAIFAYCLIVLRTIRGSGGEPEFVPSLAVFFAFIMALGGVGILIYFIHHIASSIQASSIIASVAHETNVAIDRLLPQKQGHSREIDEGQNQLEQLDAMVWYPVPAAESGYIQNVDAAALLRLAVDSRSIIRMEYGIGAFVVQNTALVSLALTYAPDQNTIETLNAAFSIGRFRTIEQDPAFGNRQIVDIAIKALSPGVNDTSTAVICIDYLTSIMARLVSRQFPSSYRYEQETLRVIAIVLSFEKLLDETFDQIRGSAEVNVAILLCMLHALDTIASLTNCRSHIQALDEQLQRIAEQVGRTIKATHDRAQLERRLSEVREALEAQAVLCAGVVEG